MIKRITVLMFTLLVALIFSTIANAEATPSPDNPVLPTPEINRTVTAQPLQDTPDWPIVQEIRSESVDELTGVKHLHITIIREQPINDNETLSECDSTRTSCVNGGLKYIYDIDTISTSEGWITAHAAHWQNKYRRSDSSYYLFRKPYQLRVWWTRSNQSWQANDVDVAWGCQWCLVCEEGSSTYLYTDSFTAPMWSGNTSYYYTYTSTSWPKMDQYDVGGWQAGSDSEARYSSIYKGQLRPNADG